MENQSANLKLYIQEVEMMPVCQEKKFKFNPGNTVKIDFYFSSFGVKCIHSNICFKKFSRGAHRFLKGLNFPDKEKAKSKSHSV